MRLRITLALVVSLLALLLLAAVASADSGGTHVVRAGETLASIARKYGVSTVTLANVNGIRNPDLIRIGQKLVIPAGGKSSGSSSGGTAKPAAKTYVVRAGDTLNVIAARLGVSTAALAAANGLSNPNRIYPGMTLRVPAGSKGAATGPVAPKPSSTRFVASISSQHCWLYFNGSVIGDWKCSTGRRGARTLPGTYRVQSKIRNAYAPNWDFWMPYWLGIYWAGTAENGIHGLPYNKATGRQTWAGMVGTPITFGCVMLDDKNAKRLWDFAWIGMPVIVTK